MTNNNVIQAHTEKYSLQDAVRLISSGAHFNFGVDEETQFGRSRQGSLTGGPDSVTWKRTPRATTADLRTPMMGGGSVSGDGADARRGISRGIRSPRMHYRRRKRG